jgi:hypothetical protein
MTGFKFKLAHKRADNEKWSASDRAQRRRLIKFLERVIEDLAMPEAQEPHDAAPKPKPRRSKKAASAA